MAVSGYITIMDKATPPLRNLDAAGWRRIKPRIATAVTSLIKDHLFQRDQQGNKNGWPSQHFYSGAAKATSWTILADGVQVSINKQGFRQRLQGGVIKPVTKKLLAIPARAEAYGKRPFEFANLKVKFGKRSDGSIGPVALVAREGGAQRAKFSKDRMMGDGHAITGIEEGMVLFWLVKQVTQQGDPSILPTQTQMETVALAAAEAGALRLLSGAQN